MQKIEYISIGKDQNVLPGDEEKNIKLCENSLWLQHATWLVGHHSVFALEVRFSQSFVELPTITDMQGQSQSIWASWPLAIVRNDLRLACSPQTVDTPTALNLEAWFEILAWNSMWNLFDLKLFGCNTLYTSSNLFLEISEQGAFHSETHLA